MGLSRTLVNVCLPLGSKREGREEDRGKGKGEGGKEGRKKREREKEGEGREEIRMIQRLEYQRDKENWL